MFFKLLFLKAKKIVNVDLIWTNLWIHLDLSSVEHLATLVSKYLPIKEFRFDEMLGSISWYHKNFDFSNVCGNKHKNKGSVYFAARMAAAKGLVERK